MPEYQDQVKAVVDEHKKQAEAVKEQLAGGDVSLEDAAKAETDAIVKLRADLLAMHKQHSEDIKSRKPPPLLE